MEFVFSCISTGRTGSVWFTLNFSLSNQFTLRIFWSQIIIFYNLVKLVVLTESKQTDTGLIQTSINKFWSRYRFYFKKKLRANWSESKMLWEQIIIYRSSRTDRIMDHQFKEILKYHRLSDLCQLRWLLLWLLMST
jgi:hypothetical protein